MVCMLVKIETRSCSQSSGVTTSNNSFTEFFVETHLRFGYRLLWMFLC